ncbi:MAG: RecX family transcriptional regulator [Bacteroidales bacterium]|nr:RecX family transcriptional regulator [Bacteroidales bacterium]
MTETEALARLQKICSMQEKCIADIKQKLKDWKINDKQAGDIIKKLVATKFIDEHRYSGSFVNDKFRLNGWGKAKIAYALRMKGIDAEIIRSSLQNIDEEHYLQALSDMLRKKMKTIKAGNMMLLRQKLFRYAISKGYESETVNRAIRLMGMKDNQDTY